MNELIIHNIIICYYCVKLMIRVDLNAKIYSSVLKYNNNNNNLLFSISHNYN